MTFGKKYASEADETWSKYHSDTKKIKKAVRDDFSLNDQAGTLFCTALANELEKVSVFVLSELKILEVALAADSNIQLEQLKHHRERTRCILKLVALNYVAVIRLIKKRNKLMKLTFRHGAAVFLHAVDLLRSELLFIMPVIASCAARIEVLIEQSSMNKGVQSFSEGCLCGVCSGELISPLARLTKGKCCWACLLGYMEAVCMMTFPESSDGTLLGCKDVSMEVPESKPSARAFKGNSGTSERCCDCFESRQAFTLEPETVRVTGLLSMLADYLKKILLLATEAAAIHAGLPTKSLVLAPSWSIVPYQQTHLQGRLTVLLDLDGTLVSTFAPKRIPPLVPGVRTHLVGVGSMLNPDGVAVIERPGLQEFLEKLSAFAEIIIFTAGLEDYASPIIDAIDPAKHFFAARIYREGTVRSPHYPCVKDISRLVRNPARTVLLDDTPLAFLHQPDNGIPISAFRGDPQDDLLLTAAYPLLVELSQEITVQPILRRRFDMRRWFTRLGFPAGETSSRSADGSMLTSPTSNTRASPAAAKSIVSSVPATCHLSTWMQNEEQGSKASLQKASAILIADIDEILLGQDLTRMLVERLAPELVAMLSGGSSNSERLPVVNAVLAELARRGIARDHVVGTLHALGAEIADGAAVAALRSAWDSGAHLRLTSKSNTLFIKHFLAGAGLSDVNAEVIACPARFERVKSSRISNLAALGADENGVAMSGGVDVKLAHHQVVIALPRSVTRPDGKACVRCGSEACMSRDVWHSHEDAAGLPIILLDSGRLDGVCASLALARTDILLARDGSPASALAQSEAEMLSSDGEDVDGRVLLSAAGVKSKDARIQFQASVRVWRSYEELDDLCQTVLAA